MIASWTLLLAMLPIHTGPDTIVVCPEAFRPALVPWMQHRESQGHRLAILSNLQTPQALRAQICELGKMGTVRAVVLVGDDDPLAQQQLAVRQRSIGSFRTPAKVNIHWGSEPEIATDNPYADIDGDGLPDVAIGRIPADTPGELTTIVGKILAYEKRPMPGNWKRRVHFVAGVGGFGLIADSALEMVAKRFITTGIPSSYETSMTYASWRSPFCPDPRIFRRTTVERLNEGSLFFVYIGHGQRTYLDYVRVPDKLYPILSTRDVPALSAQSGLPIALFLACYTGAFDYATDCLAEDLVVSADGPVAALGGSRVTMPYAMAILSTNMMDEYFTHQRPTLGEVFLHAKRNLVVSPEKGSPQHSRRRWIDILAKTISPKPELMQEEREEHLSLFNLIGDPLLRLPQPTSVKMTVPSQMIAGDEATLSLELPFSGRCHIELTCRRDRTKQPIALRGRYQDDDQTLDAFMQTYHQANDKVWHHVDIDVTPDQLHKKVEFTIPADAIGPGHISVFLENPTQQFALGSADVTIAAPTPVTKAETSADSPAAASGN